MVSEQIMSFATPCKSKDADYVGQHCYKDSPLRVMMSLSKMLGCGVSHKSPGGRTPCRIIHIPIGLADL